MGADNGTAKRKYCPECGSAIQPGSSFCANCGHPLTDASDSQRAGQPIDDARPRSDEPTDDRRPSSTMAYAPTGDTSSDWGTGAAGPSESQDTAHEFDDFWATGDLGPMDAMDDEPITAAPISVPPRKKGIGVGVAIAVVLGIVAIVGVGVFFFRDEIFGLVSGDEQAQANEGDVAATEAQTEEGLDVPLSFDISGYDPNTDTAIPVVVTVTDEHGNESDALAFVHDFDKGIQLQPGEYTLTFPYSPITEDGRLYDPPTGQLDIVVYDTEGNVKGNDATIPFTLLDPVDESLDFINNSYNIATKDPLFESNERYKEQVIYCKDMAVKVYDEAINEVIYQDALDKFEGFDGGWYYYDGSLAYEVVFYGDEPYVDIFKAVPENGVWHTGRFKYAYKFSLLPGDNGDYIGYRATLEDSGGVYLDFYNSDPHRIKMVLSPDESYWLDHTSNWQNILSGIIDMNNATSEHDVQDFQTT